MKELLKKNLIIAAIVILSIVLSNIVFSQDYVSNSDIKKLYSIVIPNISNYDIKDISIKWLDDNRILLRASRKLLLVKNIIKGELEIINLTNYLMKEDSGEVTTPLYIKELDYIVFAEEKPEPTIKLYNGKGYFIDYLMLNMSENKFDINFVSSLNDFLILYNGNLLLVRSFDNFDVLETDVVSYLYKENSNEILIQKKTSNNNSLIIRNLNNKNQTEITTDKIDYFDYYPTNGILYYAEQIKENIYNVYLYEYKSDNKLLPVMNNISKLENIIYNTINNKLIEFRPDNTIMYIKSEGTNDNLFQSFNLTTKQGESLIEPIYGVSGFYCNNKTKNVILYKPNGKENYGSLHSISLDELSNERDINNHIYKANQYFKCKNEKDVISYVERYEDLNNIVLYNIDDNIELFKIKNVFTDSSYNISIENEELFCLTYKSNNNIKITEMYNNGEYYSIENSTACELYSEDQYALIKTEDNVDKLVIYKRIEEKETISESQSNSNNILNMNFGIKLSGLLTLLSQDVQTTNTGYEIGIFANYQPFSFIEFSLNMVYGRRQFSFNPEYVTGEDPLMVKSIVVYSDLLSIQLQGNIIFPSNNNMELYLPIGFRVNYSFNDVLYKELTTGGSVSDNFSNEMKMIHYDLAAGLGFNYSGSSINLFAELLFYFSLGSAFEESYLTQNFEINNQVIYPFGLQLNIGLSLFGFNL